MKINFSGKVVLVAGGTGGLGNAVSLAFLKEGAKVVVTYRKEEEFAALKQAAGCEGGGAGRVRWSMLRMNVRRGSWLRALSLDMAEWMRW